jgi:hypothetical protein
MRVARAHTIGFDSGAGAAARIDQPAPAQRLERLVIDRAALTLADHRLVGLESEPREILEDPLLVLPPAALPIVILDPQ